MNINTIFNIPSQDVYASNYRQYIVSQNATINPNIPNTDFWYKSIALGGLVAGGVADASYNYINIFPQYQSGVTLNISLGNKGVPTIFPATYATALLTTVTQPAYQFQLLAGMQLIDNTNNAIYEIQEDFLVNTLPLDSGGNWQSIPSIATVLGSGNILNTGVILTLSVPIIDEGNNQITQLTVYSSVDGSNQETDEEANTRLLDLTKTPRAGARTTDIKYLLLPSVNNYLGSVIVTDIITIPNNQFLNGTYNYGVFGLSGTTITDTILNQGLIPDTTYTIFDRSITSETIAVMSNVLGMTSLINSTPFVNSIQTQSMATQQSSVVTPYFQIKVTLAVGYSLSTVLNVTNSDGSIIFITVQQLIQREVRRAICSQSYGGLQTINSSGAIISTVIPISAIEQQLDYALGTSQYNGIYATILLDRQVFIYSSGSGESATYQYANIPLNVGIPSPPTTDTLQYIYDIANDATIGYENILVVLI